MTTGSAQPHSVGEANPSHSGGGSTGGDDLVSYFLGELERRVGRLEDSVSDIRNAVTTVKAQMAGVATKHTVSFWIVGVVVVNLLTLLGHLLI